MHSNKLFGFALFLHTISFAVPWSGEILIYLRPKVMFIALNLKKIFKRYQNLIMIHSNYYIIFFKIIFEKVSATNGPIILVYFFNLLIAGIIIFISSEFFSNSELCGFRPKTAIFGFLLNNFFNKKLMF